MNALEKLYGTGESLPALRRVTTGPLSFFYSQEGLRRISWNGTELVRALAWPIRDENWGTYPVEIVDEWSQTTHDFEAGLKFAVGGGRLTCDLHIHASSKGVIVAELTMTPNNGTFATNRAGFTVLHPIKGVAGSPLAVTHSNGTRENTRFPLHIQPDQPVKDISELKYELGGQGVAIVFGGEVFEMEDQRNWSDASYKTYCVPLVYPFTYEISQPTKQSVRITCDGDAVSSDAGAVKTALHVAQTKENAIDVGLALEADWLPKTDIALSGFSHVLLRTTPNLDRIDKLADFLRGWEIIDLEIVLPAATRAESDLQELATALENHGIVPRRVIALPEAYLGSHQPVGPWPDGAAPNDILDAVRQAFPKSMIGGGMLTNFTEMNRYRPDVSKCDYVTHSLTPLVHAGDDMSVLETLEALPQIFSSTDAMAKGLPYRLGLSSIGMRSNPYGAAVAQNPAQVRRTMAKIEPRHRGLFGSAFAVGVLAATYESNVEAICLGAPVGPFGLCYEPNDYPQAGYDGARRAVYPLFHVVREACLMAGHPRLSIAGIGDGVSGYGALIAGAARIMMANTTDTTKEILLGQAASVTILDAQSFDAATASPDWLANAAQTKTEKLSLSAFSVAFIEMETAPN